MSNTTRRNRITEAQNGVCFYCNEPLSNPTVEHIVPRAVYKWTKEYLKESDYKRLRGVIQSRKNLVVVHESCNVGRGLSDISVEHLSPGNRKFVKSKIRFYNNTIQSALENQGNKCYLCKKYINGTSYPRRKTNGKRVIENCAVLCFKCNMKIKHKGLIGGIKNECFR